MLHLRENRETLIRGKFRQHRHIFFSSLENGHFYSTLETVMDGNSSTLLFREHSEPRKCQHSGLQAVLTDQVRIGPVTGLGVFKIAGTFVMEVQTPSQQPENPKSWVRKSGGIEQYVRQGIPTEN